MRRFVYLDRIGHERRVFRERVALDHVHAEPPFERFEEFWLRPCRKDDFDRIAAIVVTLRQTDCTAV